MTEHILDNPIYYALDSGNKDFINGTRQARYFPEDVSPLAGLRENTEADLDSLEQMVSGKRYFILFCPEEIKIAGNWKTLNQLELLQMVYERPKVIAGPDPELIGLSEQHVAAMLELTKMTNPGPFLSATIRLGNYRGIFVGEQLVAMAGQRLQPLPYVEVSAVCTHPDHLGKGYAGRLITDQVRRIIGNGGIPFLHSKKDNKQAISLYQKLGFTGRREMLCYVIARRDD